MNDLKLLYSIENQINDFNGPLEFISFDTNMGKSYASDHNKVYEIDSTTNKIFSVFDLDKQNYSNSNENKLILFQFLTESNNISLINLKGDLYLMNVLNSQIEGVGMIPDGLSAAQWSPDQELLVLFTNSNVLILMTKDFDILVEQPISVQNQVESSFVNVGWGSYETQFKGSEGKKTIKQKCEEEKCQPWDDKKGRFCWRSDGEYFILNFVNPETNSRKFQVFTRDGVLHSTIENDLNILDAPIAWKFSKSLIASSVYRLNKHEILFFERNGLAHGSITLPFSINQMKVNGIFWNLDSTILCVWSELVDSSLSSSSFQSIVQLWTVNNYHWYLKQSYNFDISNKITTISWDPEDSYGLHLLTCTGQYIKYKLAWTVNSCNSVVDYNGSIAVADGQNVLITPFSKKIIPPPMSLYKLQTSSFVNNIIWSQFNMDILVYLMNGDLIFFKYQKKITDNKNLDTYEYVLNGQVKFPNENFKKYNSSIQHILWKNEIELFLIAETKENRFKMFLFELSRTEKNLVLNKKNELDLEYPVANLTYNEKTKHLAIQSSNGLIIKYDEHWKIIDQFQFVQPCPNFSFVQVKNEDNEETEIFIGLTQFYRLYANKTEIANNCNSYCVHDEFLLFTDHSNNLKFVELKKLKDTNGKNMHEEALRRVERGAKLLIALHNDTGCILQMPRGNLEFIHPRTLVISKLKNNIENLKYLNAVEMMRKHRVNMNILFDHNPQKFLKSLPEFVKQIENPSLINLFLTELSDEDTTKTYYKDHYIQKNLLIKKDLNSNIEFKNKNKLNEVCSSLIDICQSVNDSKYFLVILSCYAKMKELEKALYKIIQAKSTNNQAVDEGLRHLLYIVDVNEMFDVALGTYDFDIVLMVAEKSQKDPKEYLPFLNDLKKLEENFRKYKIDLYLKRYKKALHSIIKCGAEHHEEVLKLTDDHKLYTEALKFYNLNDDLFKKISKLFATHLSVKKYYEEAGMVLFRANLLEDCLEVFLKCSNWQMFISACIKLKLTGAELNKNIHLIIEKLQIENKFYEMATIYEQYLNDSENSIINLINGCYWQEAINSIHKFNRFDFFETNLIPALKTNHQDTLKSIEQHESKFIELKQRLSEVRIEKAKKRENDLENEQDEEFRQRDDMSISEMSSSTFDNESQAGSIKSTASTVNSQFSGKSTSKRRKQKKSLISLKKGSFYEDLALIKELSDNIYYVYKMKDGIFNLSKALLLFNLNDLCISLQTKYECLIDLIEKNTNQIWDNIDSGNLNDSYTIQSYLATSVTDYSKIESKYRYPPEAISKRQWKLHIYE